jgi:hypothetical protein
MSYFKCIFQPIVVIFIVDQSSDRGESEENLTTHEPDLIPLFEQL